MVQKTTHGANLIALRRIEGQVKGIQKMIENKKYCIDIVNQVHAAINALHKVSEKILGKHIEYCVMDALKGGSQRQKDQKMDEMMKVIRRLHKLS